MKPLILILLFFSIGMPVSISAETGDIQGTVYQRSTGRPLVDADVRILETDQLGKTDANGNFRFTELPAGTYTFIVTHPSVETPTEVSVAISAGGTTEVKIHLGTAFKLETVVVEGKRLAPTISRTEVRGQELLRIPGTLNDTLKGLMTLPSIGIPNDYFGALYIRGSEPGSTLYYLDRTPLGYPFHWGGLLSTISSETLEKIDIYAGGYGAEFGLDSQAVLDIYARERIDKPWHSKFNLNILYSEALLEARIGDNGYVSASGRRSYLDLIAGPLLTDEFGTAQQLPYLSDYQLKSTYALTKKHRLTLNAFAAADRFHIVEVQESLGSDFDTAADEELRNSAEFENGFNGQGLHLRSNFSDRLRSDLSFTRSNNFLNIGFHGIVAEQVSQSSSGEGEHLTNSLHYDLGVSAPVYAVREDLSYQLTPTAELESGFLWSFSPARSSEKGRLDEEFPLEDDFEDVFFEDVDEDDFEDVFFEDIDETFGHDFYRTEGYLQGRYDAFSFVSVALGVRLAYLNVTEQVYLQPRGSVSFQLANGSNLRFAYGRYEQSPQPSDLLGENGNPGLKSSRTRHYILELEQELSARTTFKLATYYKDSRDLVTEDAVSNFLNQGSAFVSGAEAFLRHRIPDRFFGWISYAYTHAERRDTPTAAYQPYLFDNTHIMSIVANYQLTPTIEIGGKWQYLSGTGEAPISSIVLIQDPVTRGLNPLLASADDQLSTSLSPYHKLDVRIRAKWELFGAEIGGFIDILNVYNRTNEIQFIFEEAAFDVQGQEIGIDREVFDAPQLPRLIYFGLTFEL